MTGRRSKEELQAIREDSIRTVPHGEWIHKEKGFLVFVCGHAFDEETLVVKIIYIHDTILWLRPMDNFLERFTLRRSIE